MMEVGDEEFTNNVLESLAHGYDTEQLDVLINVINSKLDGLGQQIDNREMQINNDLHINTLHGECECEILALHCFLNNVEQAVKRNVGLEDFISEDLIKFCQRNSIILLLSSENPPENSLNTPDLSADHTRTLWMKIRTKLKLGIMSKLMKLSAGNSDATRFEYDTFIRERRVHLFKLLNCLYTLDKCLLIYVEYRDVELTNKCSVTSSGIEEIGACLGELCKSHCSMFKEDALLLQSIALDGISDSPLKELFSLYSKHFQAFVTQFVSCYISQEFKCESFEFSVEELRRLAKVLGKCFEWTEQMEKICMSVHDFKEREEPLRDYYQLKQVVSPWEIVFEPCILLVTKFISAYLNSLARIFNKSHDGFMCLKHELTGEYPFKVTKPCGDFLSLLSEMVVFTKIRSLSDAVSTLFNELLYEYINCLDERMNMFGKYINQVETIYSLIADCCLCEKILEDWDRATETRGSFVGITQTFSKKKDTYVDLLIDHHLKILTSALVFDVHSNNWMDERYFFEGEQCSFPVQMFNVYIAGIQADLNAWLPRHLAKFILNEITLKMLEFFTARYLTVKPLYKRTKQVKGDIQLLLKVFYWLYFSFVQTEDDFMNGNELYQTLCNTLYETMAVLCIPINMVADALEQQPLSQGNVDWKVMGRADERQSIVIFNILLSNNFTDDNLVVKFLTMNRSEVAISLLTYTEHLRKPTFVSGDFELPHLNKLFTPSNQLKVKEVNKREMTDSLYKILVGRSNMGFIDFMTSLIKVDFSKSFKTSEVEELPLWMQLFASNTTSILKRILEPAYKLIFHADVIHARPSFTFTKLQTLPCGCPTVPEVDEKLYNNTSQLLHKCLLMTLDALVNNLETIPRQLWLLIGHIKEDEEITASWVKQVHLGTKVLASLLYNWLCTPSNIQHLSHVAPISPETADKIRMFAELLWHIVYNLSHDVTDNPRISMDVHGFLVKSAVVVQQRLARLDERCNVKAGSCQERAENGVTIPSQTDAMQNIKTTLQFNKGAISEMIALNSPVSIETLRRHANALQSTREMFNPIEALQKVGDEPFEHFSLLNNEFDWSDLLSRVPENKWRMLVSNRFEFQKSSETFLLDEEKKSVERIKEALET